MSISKATPMDPLVSKFQEAVDLDDIPGAVLVASDSTGEFKYEKSIGNRTLLDGTKKPLETDAVLAVFSATKLITAIAALQCVEKGYLSLDEPISGTLPHFKDVKVLLDIEDGKPPQFENPKQAVTLRHLLTHSAGTTYEWMDPKFGQWRQLGGTSAAQGAPTVEGRYSSPLSFQPGTRFGYGTGSDWAGKAVEKVTSQTLQQYFDTNIFGPLGVRDASFFPMENESMKQRMVDLNPQDPTGVGLAPVGGAPLNANVTDCFGGHGLFMTAPGYIKILHSLLADDGKLLKSHTLDLLFEPNLGPEAHELINVEAAERMAQTPVGAGLPVDSKRDYALGGLLLQQDLPNWYQNGTITWGGAWNSVWFIDRKTGLCGFGAPQVYLRDAPMQRGDGYVFEPHREGGMRWEATTMHFKQVFREGIYQIYRDWKNKR